MLDTALMVVGKVKDHQIVKIKLKLGIHIYQSLEVAYCPVGLKASGVYPSA